jgi:hypothetical protein
MIVTCNDCGKHFDDAERWTCCPHEPFMSADDLAQKDLALSLIGKEIRFAHMPNGPYYRVQSVNYIGMVTIARANGDTMGGEFAPHLFVVQE